MGSPTESSLLSALESSNAVNTYDLFTAYLKPFAALSNPKKPSKRPSKSATDQTSIRSLAKQFLSFLNSSLRILPKRLSDPSRIDQSAASGLFETYRLCLDCLDLVSSQLSCKPYMVDLQRMRMVHCFEGWGLYREAEREGLGVLGRLKKVEGRWLPGVEEGGGDDGEFVLLVVEVVVTLVKCAAMGKSKEGLDYRRVLDLVEEVKPWFRMLDAGMYDKLHRVLVTYLGKCALFLVGELTVFDEDLLRAFCMEALTKYAESSMKDQIYKFACRICSCLFSQQEKRLSVATDLLISALDSVARQCKVETEATGVQLVELVSYCANKCRASSARFHEVLAAHIYKIAGDFHKVLVPLDTILRLYATGLYFTDCSLKLKHGDFTSSRGVVYEFVVRISLDDRERLHCVVSSLKSAKSYFSIDCYANYTHSSFERKDSDGRIYSCMDDSEASRAFLQKSRETYLLPYINALKFLCQPLAESVNSEKKLIVGENEDASVSTELCHIEDTLYQFCDGVLCHSYKSQEGDGFDANNKIILSAAVAAFTLSVRTQLKMKNSVNLIKHIIASEWIQPHGLKLLFASLYNVGVILYRNKQMKEASKALKLSCRASWTCVVHLCHVINKSNNCAGDLTEDGLLEFISDVCSKSTFLLDVLQQCGSNKAKRIILHCLESWSIAGNLLKKLPCPKRLVKQWVKIECKLQQITDEDECSTTLYCSLSSSAKVSERTIGILLEEELAAYEEMVVSCPKFCQRMQMKIIDILLQHVYVTHNFYVEKARILIRKGKALRTLGEGLEDCIQCLSEAICIMKDMQGKTYGSDISICHQSAVAYSLRALCTQEAEPKSQQVFEDINAAINLWLSIPFPDHCFENDRHNIVSRSTMILLYNIIDLLSMKGCVEFHKDIYQLIIRFFKWKNISPETCLAALWEWRRLSHALCISPVNESFIVNLSGQCGELSRSIDFWIHCFNGSQPLEVGFKQSLSFSFSTAPSNSLGHDSVHQSDITFDDVKGTALELISAGSFSQVKPSSIFVAGYLYYDLCERLISKGQLSEALSYAKEAHRLRTKLFQEKFMYSIEQHSEKDKGTGENIDKHTHGISTLKVVRSVVKEVLSFDAGSWDLEGYLSPWKVLQCYLESTLQVGVIHEIIGNGAEAETFLLWGKNISCSQSLPLFIVAFSSVLGKLYRKKQLWDMAKNELINAKQILANDSATISCLKCRLLQEVTIDQQLGDLSRSQFDGSEGSTSERPSTAEDLYRTALEKLGLPEWKNPVSYPEEVNNWKENINSLVKDVELSDNNSCASCTSTESNGEVPYIREGPKAKTEAKRSRKTKNSSKPLAKENALSDNNSRVTRSRYRSSQSQSVNVSSEVQTGRPKQSNSNHASDIACQERLLPVVKSSVINSEGEVTCICNNVGCWLCLLSQVMKSGLVTSFINVKWEFARRQCFLRVLAGIGKCLGSRGLIHEAHEISLQSISTLVSRNPFHHAYSSGCSAFLVSLLGKEITGDVLAVERAAVIYNICWLSLKCYCSKDARINCCIMSNIQLPNIVSWLMLAFVLSREVPALLQKVSRLLAVIYLLSTSMESFSLSTSCKVLSGNHWAAYFHQASVGTHLNHQLFSNMTMKHAAEHLIISKDSHASSTCTGAESCNPLRLAPESVQDLENFVMNFYGSLPCSTVICISMLGGAYACLLQDLLPYPSQVHAWMVISRFSSKNQPVVVLLPVDSILEEASNDDDNDEGSSGSAKFDEIMYTDKHWRCPWRYAVVDDVAPAFKQILEENYLSSSVSPIEDTKRYRTLWWARRKKLDHRLGTLLRNLEESWLGPWKYLLRGEWSNSKLLDSINMKVVRDLRSKCKLAVDENLIRAVLGGVRNSFEMEACIPQLCSNKGCCIPRYSDRGEESRGTLFYTSNAADKLSMLASQLLCEAVNDIENEDSVDREPVILVLDCEIQMLPWENLPILRNQEVYRMPSLGSILASLEKSCHRQEQTGSLIAAFPLIDPLDAFYLLNPSGDLSSTQVQFEKWFRDQNLEGKAGSAPTAEELAVALKSHDLFIYFGHGSGVQYIPKCEIQKLENCAATLLMGCSSGSLSLNGPYIPQGAPLSYLLAGSPVIVANLWEVTDKDIDRFAKAMLDAWLTERSSCSTSCLECSSVAKEFEAMTIKSCKANIKKKATRKKSPKRDRCSDWCSDHCEHRPKIGSFMGQAREACTLPFLIGAAPVCYGVPTGIRRKEL